MASDLQAPRTPSDPERHVTRSEIAVLAVLLVLGLLNVPQPFGWDQALFALGAEVMRNGGLLYRDFWDVKSPGIFAFYYLGGTIFGLSEMGIHTFELIYLLVFAVVLSLTLRGYYEHRWAVGLAPLLSIGFFLAVTRDTHLTQVEGLVGFPLYLALWFATRAPESERGRKFRLLASGIAGGFVILFKYVFFPIVACFWLSAAFALWRQSPEQRLSRLIAASGATLLGFLVPLGFTAGYFAAHGALGLAWQATFIYPAQAMSRGHIQVTHFIDGLTWFVSHWAPVLGLAFLGAFSALRHRRSLFDVNLVLWCVSGAFVFLSQRLSYYQYHYPLFMVPLGILAARGLEQLAPTLTMHRGREDRRAGRFAAIMSLLLFFSYPIGNASLKVLYLAHDGFALTKAGRSRFMSRVSRRHFYPEILVATSFVARPEARRGPIYVVGNPLYNWLSGREHALPRHGSILVELLTEQEWADVTARLTASPPAYILIEKRYLERLQRPPGSVFFSMLTTDYDTVHEGDFGAWYAPRGSSAPRM